MVDDLQLHVFEMRNLPQKVRERFHSDMRLVVDYLAEGAGFRSANYSISTREEEDRKGYARAYKKV